MNASGKDSQSGRNNPLLSDSPRIWDDLIQSVGPASLIVAIESRLGSNLRQWLSAEDILQEALLQAWNSRDTCEWRGLKSFRSWILSIIDNRIRDAADHIGAAKRGGHARAISLDRRPEGGGQTSMPSGHIMPLALIDTTTPSRLAMYREQALAMQGAIQELPDELRDVVRMRLVEQLPLDAIAQSLGLGVAAVRHRFRKGAELYHQRLKRGPNTHWQPVSRKEQNSMPQIDGISAPDE